MKEKKVMSFDYGTRSAEDEGIVFDEVTITSLSDAPPPIPLRPPFCLITVLMLIINYN